LEVEPEQGQAQDLAANPETQETAAEAHSQNLLPNTGTESKSLLALAGFSILALLGLGWLIKNKKKN
jgi:pullulanase